MGPTDAQMNELHRKNPEFFGVTANVKPPEYLKIDETDLMASLRAVLLQLPAAELSKIGVTIKREEGEWEWLRDAFVAALEREDREKAAAGLRGNDMAKSVSIGVSRSFLIELAKLLDERAS